VKEKQRKSKDKGKSELKGRMGVTIKAERKGEK
jgi:hypothetical protein